ncbi:MAG: hypothetical protein K2L34_03715, partial [Muribaculaceae bacterium]|nr:hypothetical protein [Muribaculaceae bacterium]
MATNISDKPDKPQDQTSGNSKDTSSQAPKNTSNDKTQDSSIPKAIKPNPIVVAGLKYRKEVILLVCVLIAFGIYALKVMDKNKFPSFTIREGVVAAV